MVSAEWTSARKRSFIVAVLRQGTRRYPPKYQTLNEAKTVKKVNTKTGRQAQHYACAKCKKDFPQKEVEVDHIQAVVDPRTGFVDWNTYIERMFCDKENLAVLCKPCHKRKTDEENKQSKLTRNSKQKPAPLSSRGKSRTRNSTSSLKQV